MAGLWEERKATILKNDERLFKYRSTDGATVEERKIGDASNAAFERAVLSPLAKGNS